MSNVNLAIGGRVFTVACASGEEAHVTRLGRVIDEKVTATGALPQNETRMLLFAALMLADELHEAQTALAQMTPQPQADDATSDGPAVARRINDISDRLESLAQHLEQQATSA